MGRNPSVGRKGHPGQYISGGRPNSWNSLYIESHSKDCLRMIVNWDLTSLKYWNSKPSKKTRLFLCVSGYLSNSAWQQVKSNIRNKQVRERTECRTPISRTKREGERRSDAVFFIAFLSFVKRRLRKYYRIEAQKTINHMTLDKSR